MNLGPGESFTISIPIPEGMTPVLGPTRHYMWDKQRNCWADRFSNEPDPANTEPDYCQNMYPPKASWIKRVFRR